MKQPKDEPTLMEILRKGLEEAVDSIDLDEIHVPAKVLREIQRLNRSGDFAAAESLYISSVLNGVTAAEEKKLLGDWARSKGGDTRGKQKADEASEIREWLYPLLAKCDAELPLERKNRGWKTMQAVARGRLNSEIMDDPRKDLITRARVQAWIDQGRPKE